MVSSMDNILRKLLCEHKTLVLNPTRFPAKDARRAVCHRNELIANWRQQLRSCEVVTNDGAVRYASNCRRKGSKAITLAILISLRWSSRMGRVILHRFCVDERNQAADRASVVGFVLRQVPKGDVDNLRTQSHVVFFSGCCSMTASSPIFSRPDAAKIR